MKTQIFPEELATADIDSHPDQINKKFKADWEIEYCQIHSNPDVLRTASICSGLLCFYSIGESLFYSEGGDGTGGDEAWVLLSSASMLVCGLWAVFVLVLTSRRATRTLCIKMYSPLSITTLFLAYVAGCVQQVFIEFRRARFQRKGFEHIHWAINYDRFLPERTCNDTDPVRSWSGLDDAVGFSVGCENSVLSPLAAVLYIVVTMCPILLTMNKNCSLILAFILLGVLSISMLSVGVSYQVMLLAAVFQLVLGLIAHKVCAYEERISRRGFALSKATSEVFEKNRNLLHTFIPENICRRLESDQSLGMHAAMIPHCTVMFCTLQNATELQNKFSEEIFQLLNLMFCEFDDAVNRHGMFKYQHAGEWYIVACPRAACPFDEAAQSAEYPHEHTRTMVLLADELQTISRRYHFEKSEQLILKVGLNCGPVAGAVIGSHRRFYCLYGDTINTAARMCKYARDQIHCTSTFAQSIQALGFAALHCVSRGFVDIKGKGPMETFDVCILYASRVAESHDSAGPYPDDAVGARVRDPSGPRAAWAARTGREQEKGCKLGINNMWATFADLRVEGEFQREQLCSKHRETLVGALLHLVAILQQLYNMHSPEHDHDFAALGSEALAEGQRKARLIIWAHAVISAAYCTGLAVRYCHCRRPQYQEICWKRHLVVLNISFLAASCAACSQHPALWGWLLVVPATFVMLSAWIGMLAFGPACLLAGGAFVGSCVSLRLLQAFSCSVAIYQLFVLLLSISGSRIANLQRRILWRTQAVHVAEVSRLRATLNDLLPPTVAKHLLNKDAPESSERTSRPGISPCERLQAAVLQLDICQFTVMCQTLSPLEVATMVHRLFSEFDKALLSLGLFKMDTVGDAYIAAGFLAASATGTDGGEGAACHCAEEEDTRHVCQNLLALAGSMLSAVRHYRADTGRAVHCRIGVSVGPVLAGVLGRLQPRFHIFGGGLRAAEQHEQAGTAGAVHASAAFLRLMSGSSMAIPAGLAYPDSVNRSESTKGGETQTAAAAAWLIEDVIGAIASDDIGGGDDENTGEGFMACRSDSRLTLEDGKSHASFGLVCTPNISTSILEFPAEKGTKENFSFTSTQVPCAKKMRRRRSSFLLTPQIAEDDKFNPTPAEGTIFTLLDSNCEPSLPSHSCSPLEQLLASATEENAAVVVSVDLPMESPVDTMPSFVVKDTPVSQLCLQPPLRTVSPVTTMSDSRPVRLRSLHPLFARLPA